MFKDISVNLTTLKKTSTIFSIILLKSHHLSHPSIKAASFQPFSLLLHASLSSYSFQPSHCFLPPSHLPASSPQPQYCPCSSDLHKLTAVQMPGSLESTSQPALRAKLFVMRLFSAPNVIFPVGTANLLGTANMCGTVKSAFKTIIEKKNIKKRSLSWPLSTLNIVDMAIKAAINSGYWCELWLRASSISIMIQWICLEGGPHGPPYSLECCFYKWYMSWLAQICDNRERKKRRYISFGWLTEHK